jgi:parallel beta-helix repeat protein
MRALSILAAAAASLSAGTALAATVVVGTCNPNVPQYSAIQQAVNAVPAGSTVQVCPGTYTEQVTINKNLTLTGIAYSGNDAIVIAAPSGGYVANNASVLSVRSGLPFAAGILVYEAASAAAPPKVTINNITVDASGNNVGGSYELAGIAYQNASGTIQRVTVLHVDELPAYSGDQSGQGIYAEEGNTTTPGTETISILNNHVEDYQKNGIAVRYGGTATITGNTVIGQGPTSGAAENGIELAFGVAKGTITGNTVADDVWAPDTFSDPGDAAAGILVYQNSEVSSPMKITGNSVSNTQYGISVNNNDGAVIESNAIQATHIFDGIDACSNNNFIESNRINGSDESAVHLDDSCTGTSTGNTVENNTFMGACAGILEGPSASGTVAPNVYYDVTTEQLTGTDQCAQPL